MRTTTHFVIASSPVAICALVARGSRLESVCNDPAGTWQYIACKLPGLASGAPGSIDSLLLPVVVWLPLLLVSMLVARGWGEIFARSRGRPVDSSWLMTAWLFALLVPLTLPVGYAALGLSFGLVFGCHVFGGAGRYLVSPALLAVVFLLTAYPTLLAGEVWLTTDDHLPIALAVAVASAAGAAYLVVMRVASPVFLGAGLLAFLIAVPISGAPFGLRELILGNFAFALAFVATDSTVKPRTRVGLLGFGVLFGSLAVILRVADPARPEGTWHALLLASLCVPLFDWIAARAFRTRRAADTPAEQSR